jgi:uncharacterized repeat protein (TIGR01451 family)
MKDIGADSRLFENLTRELLQKGVAVRFRALGASMSPAIRDGDMVQITPVIVSKLRKDDIVLTKSHDGLRLHRLVRADADHDAFVTRGDCGQQDDLPVRANQILGVVRSKEVRVGRYVVEARFNGISGSALRWAARASAIAGRLRRAYSWRRGKRVRLALSILCFLLFTSLMKAQVAVDSRSAASAEFTGSGTSTLAFTHTTTNAANTLLLVGVSMNIANASATTVTSVTYNGTGLNFLGAHNDSGGTRRVEMWYLLNPAAGANVPVDVVVSIPAAGATVGVVSGAVTFTGVDQTIPLGSFVSADGAAGTYSQLDVPSVVNGMILDTLAIGGNRTIAVPGPQVQNWNLSTASGTDPPGVTASGSSRTGAPSVPISETFSGSSNWSLGAVSINPSTADIAVTTSVSAVALGQNSTYNITVTNNGPSAANDVTLTDTYAATNLALVSVTPSAGTSCTTAATISCTLPTPFASGATATITVVVSTTAAGFYPNTATVADSGTPPDPNTGNNSYTAVAPVVSVVCSTATLAAGGTLSGQVNTYYPGTASVAAGATSIPIGAANGSGTIAAGSELLVIQMQDASINTSNTVAYGNGYTGSGFTTINNAGNYEFVTATGAVAGGSVPIKGAGAGGGLVFAYTFAAATATKGKSSYQVVLVPQYLSATLGAVTAAAWNGSTGGILALDVAGQLNLGGATVSLDGLGFRGAAGLQLTGGAGSNADYRHTSPANYTGGAEAGVDAPKGEGISGTPMWVESGTTYLQTTTTVGYPSGTAGTDGSMARGAPGNAGGGGTDADPAANDQNAGGGGGGNGGSGGFGGDSWNTNLSVGGEGGSSFPTTIDRIAMGGGGGAGTRNNSDGDNQASSAAAGGGIIFIRADSLTGTATLTANGASSYNATANDAGGGGGGGGTIIVLSANGGESGLTLQAKGGRGGNAWQSEAFALGQRHGPGGGGGGGVIYVSGAPASTSVAGGANGLTLNTPAVPYGSTPGNAGIVTTNATLSQVTGIQSAALCAPDMTLGKSHGGGSLTRGSTVTYLIPVSNISPYGATSGVVTVNDTLPLGLTPTSASGTGWSCSESGQTISCTNATVLAPVSSYNPITVTAGISQSAPATLINTAVVGGGGEANLLNDTATDTANVISIADIAVSDAASPNPVAAGSNITYTQVVTNNGPSAADNASLVATIPANTTLVSMTAPAGWTCLTPGPGGTGNVVCSNVDMPGVSSSSFTLVVKVNSSTASGTVITETASVNSSVSDPNPANNTASASTVVGTTAGGELTVTNSATPNPVQAGGQITYTQAVTNTGSAAATTATFTENTPANTTFVRIAQQPAGWTCTSFPPQCTNPSVAAGASGTFVIVYQVSGTATAGTVITDNVTVNASNQAFGPNTATASIVVASGTQADLALTTAASPSSVVAGNNITYTQAITNNGPASASAVSFSEATPTNTTFESVLAPAGWSCTAPAVGSTGTVNCTDPSMTTGTEADVIVVVNVPATAPQGTITANSSVTSSTSDPNSSNNSTSVSTFIADQCDLSVTNSGAPNPVSAGSNITYTQVIANSGPSNCNNATFTEAAPANTAFVSVGVTGGGSWTCPNSAPVSCSSSSVPPGATATVTAVFKVNTGTAGGTIITDTATVASTTADTNKNNNTATSTVAVASATQADLSVTSSPSPNPVNAGGTITYTQVVTNAGPAAATGVVLTETLPANTTFGSLTGPGGWTCRTTAPYTCTDGSNLALNGSATFTFVVTVSSAVASGSTITQTASVAGTSSDPNSANNSATTSVLVADSAALSITNSPSPVPVQATKNITYTQTVTNAGPSTATSVTLTETLPGNTTAVSLTGPAAWTCTVGTLSCTISSLAPGSASFTFVVTVNSGTASGTQISQTASVSSATADPNTANNTATANDVVATATQADLVVTNSASPTSVTAGSNVTYTQTVQNLGPAAATTVSFTQTTPPNTNFQSISTPGGWTCGTKPAVGGTGTITCTIGTLNTSATATTFTLVLQVNALTPFGTNITETDSISASNSVQTATASATVVVANANSADMAIVKSATPNPVTQGTPLTYTLTVTNNGPASATNVMVTDTLPSVVTYLSANATQGSCSEAGGTVNCPLGTMANAGTATITILTIPNQSGVIVNTATVIADQSDPNLANNTATQTETVTAPTSITLQYFTAQAGIDKNGARRIILSWKTGGEAHNLGFNVYREQNGNRVRINPSLIAGSALMMTGALPKHSGKRYLWVDPSAPVEGTSYWLEDVDVNGTRTMHGPISVQAGIGAAEATSFPQTRTLSQLSQAQPVSESQQSHVVETLSCSSSPTADRIHRQFELAAHPAVKISVQHEGWYRVTQPDLVKAGLDPNIDPAMLHLYAEAVEQPIEITGATGGPGGFGPQAAIGFYGTGIDTVFSGTRVYWLVSGDERGARIPLLPPAAGSNQPPQSYPATVELEQHNIYFEALLTQHGENYFGALVSSSPVDQTLALPHLDRQSSKNAHLDIILQGVIVGFPHDVQVNLNGTAVGDITFTGQEKGRMSVDVPASLLQKGNNTVTLTAQDGDYDTSLVQSIRITYPHTYTADSDELKFVGRAGDELTLKGFTSTPLVLDITDPDQPVQLTPRVNPNSGSGDLAIQVPWTSTNPHANIWHTLVAVGKDRIRSAAAISRNHPSHWHSAQRGADIAIITAREFADAIVPLVRIHEREGKSSAVILVGDLYDEFNFGERSPFAIKDFLRTASQKWEKTPRYLLLNGRASSDPRNYLGQGELDLVPTAIIPAGSLMTASDDWFSDFKNTGKATIATGRLPVATAQEAQAVVTKIVGYERAPISSTWTSNALMVADKDDTESFTQDTKSVQAMLPSGMNATDIFLGTAKTGTAPGEIIKAINSGQLLVNYLGHGSEEQWAGSNIFDTSSVSSLTNESQLSVFLIMDCLNGFFEDPYYQPLGVSLLLAPNGGAVAVLASSGLNQPAPQTTLDQFVVQNALGGKNTTIGEAILNAKSNVSDIGVRQTYVLFGDPAMQVKQPAANPH